MSFKKPSFHSLPLRKDGPPGNAWGLFGERDQLGMLNLLTPDTTIAAAREIVHGIRVSTDWPLDKFKAPCFSRVPFHQSIYHKAPRAVNDDILTFNTQSSSQWDGFRHYVWVENGGIVGRGVLLDFCSWAESRGLPSAALDTSSITLSDLLRVAAVQNVSFRSGDILLIRSGYGKAFEALTSAEAEYLAAIHVPPAIGVESSRSMLQWIWESGFSAVAGDMPSFEAWPCQDPQYLLHEWLLAGWGVPIGELFDLERLAVECKKVQKWTFFFSSMPLNVPGGVASPPNGVAVL